jgi:hypothetical protein
MPTPTQKELIMAQNWANWPLLPMVRRKVPGSLRPEDLDCAILIAGQWNVLYLANLTMLALESSSNEQFAEKLLASPRLEYTDLDALLSDGWVGD